jgi:dihydropteroate synthase
VPLPVEDRDGATAAVSTVAALAGAWCVRVHAVRPSVDAVRVAAALQPAGRVLASERVSARIPS